MARDKITRLTVYTFSYSVIKYNYIVTNLISCRKRKITIRLIILLRLMVILYVTYILGWF